MNKNKWITTFMRRIMEHADLDKTTAKQIAQANLEMVAYDLSENPIELADEELSRWID